MDAGAPGCRSAKARHHQVDGESGALRPETSSTGISRGAYVFVHAGRSLSHRDWENSWPNGCWLGPRRCGTRRCPGCGGWACRARPCTSICSPGEARRSCLLGRAQTSTPPRARASTGRRGAEEPDEQPRLERDAERHPRANADDPDLMMNRWLLYQTLSCRSARSVTTSRVVRPVAIGTAISWPSDAPPTPPGSFAEGVSKRGDNSSRATFSIGGFEPSG